MTSAELWAPDAVTGCWRVWASDEGHLYAVTTPENPYGRSFTVDAVTHEGLRAEIEKAEAAWARWARWAA